MSDIDNQAKEKLEKVVSKNTFKFFNALIYFAIIGTSILITSFLSNMIKSQEETMSKQRTEVATKREEVEELKKLKNEFPDFPAKVNALKEIETKQKDASQILAQMSQAASESGISLINFAPTYTKGIEIKITLTGPHNNLKKFLENVEKNRLIINSVSTIANVNMSKANILPIFELKIKPAGG
ncbi:TPA: hypothetical protein DDW69_03775 [candidate division CPR2 bacterium]|uniref:Uncharacterized protein n=1 Tax=candidate division CPR2 bacterium GW2011_GWC1_41_48 TaxID=1618344 RepID=A0A0G0W7Q2_UNCC2|nr:MAG: hypothetical protein UT47_C0003G0051 [candidate division CPR2 bacterium GW2011_GWC2_39_35]KKR28824.1 MAG: hypothetical protein UT59_C0018G0003 [candidate division CPR2 bacterium GW2011_GWD1_39_7]KKR29335.1 MAG: hypothetical protein UT60_C0003G0012 [candidate division CPR2 bacterium GW2011_GWD2_39_7]KKS08990.1 MAG: hypothetical protein UU65_C0003G0045 [candidate division CPR2 bacterium GW2011_GWC1_41_48]OGB61433.1 MAG: hypothetical protein A2Y27_03735 [candidate division CPR2 bacterium G